MKRLSPTLALVAATTFIAGNLTGANLVASTTTVHLSPGSQITVIADTAAPTLAPTLTPTLIPTLAPTATPTAPPMVASGPVNVTADGQVIQNLVIDSMPGQAMTLAGQTTATTSSININGHKNVVVRNVVLRGRQFGILATDTTGLILDHVTVTETNYCGICLFGGSGGSILAPTISKIGTLRTNGLPSIGDAGNAYGIKFEVASQNGGTSGPPTDWAVSGGSVANVPLWIGVNAHQCVRCTVTGMDVSGSPRAFFWVGPISNSSLTGNLVHLRNGTGSYGSGDVQSFLYGSWVGGSISNNRIDASYPAPANYQGSSSGVTVTNNTVVP